MPRGGFRAGAGRKADPNSARQQALAKKAGKAEAAPTRKARGRGFTLPNGQKSPDAPAGWPFGTKPPEEPAPPVTGPVDPESDDGLTEQQRSGMSPLDYLLAVMRSPKASKSARMTAAIQAAPYVHGKIAPGAKKEEARAKAGKAAAKFATAAPPRLVAVR